LISVANCRDSLVYIEPGSAQHFADNIMSIVDYLMSPSSPLLKTIEWSPPSIVYLSVYDQFFISWNMATADKVYTALAALAVAVTAASGVWRTWKSFAMALFGAPMGFLVGLVCALVVAGIMILLDKQLTWCVH